MKQFCYPLPAPVGFGFVIAPDEWELNGQPYQTQDFGGITIAVDDILSFTPNEAFGVIVVIDDILTPVELTVDSDENLMGVEEDFAALPSSTGGTSIIVVLDDTEYGPVFGTGNNGEDIVIYDEIFVEEAPRLLFLSVGDSNNPLQTTTLYLEHCGGGQYHWPVF